MIQQDDGEHTHEHSLRTHNNMDTTMARTPAPLRTSTYRPRLLLTFPVRYVPKALKEGWAPPLPGAEAPLRAAVADFDIHYRCARMATLGCAGSELPGQGCCRSWPPSCVIGGRGQDAWRRALPPHDISCIVWLAPQAAGGGSVAPVASGQKLSARHDGRRARDASHTWSSVAAADMASVSAAALASDASSQMAFCSGVI